MMLGEWARNGNGDGVAVGTGEVGPLVGVGMEKRVDSAACGLGVGRRDGGLEGGFN